MESFDTPCQHSKTITLGEIKNLLYITLGRKALLAPSYPAIYILLRTSKTAGLRVSRLMIFMRYSGRSSF